MTKNQSPVVAARLIKGLSAQDAAAALGITRRYLDMIEQGARTPSLKLALRFERLYGMPVSMLFPGLGGDATGTDG